MGRSGLSGDVFEPHSEAEYLELPHVSADSPFGASAIKIVGADFSVGDAISHHMKRDLEDLMTDRADDLLVAGVTFDAVILGLKR